MQRNRSKALAIVLCVMMMTAAASAAIKIEPVQYADGQQKLEGFIVYDDAATGKHPGVVIYHQWMGITDHEKDFARQLAERGHVAFVADVYGKGERPADRAEAAKFAGRFKDDRALLRRRVNLGLEQLKRHERVDGTNTAALGFCFGGTASLELARSGADVDGVISFHGGLATPTPQDARNIKGKVLVLHGAADPFVPVEEVLAFGKEMHEAGVDWHMVAYGDAVHSFTQKSAGDNAASGSAYNEAADRRSRQQMRMFLGELWGKK